MASLMVATLLGPSYMGPSIYYVITYRGNRAHEAGGPI